MRLLLLWSGKKRAPQAADLQNLAGVKCGFDALQQRIALPMSWSSPKYAL
jgi:hypothetical protein